MNIAGCFRSMDGIPLPKHESAERLVRMSQTRTFVCCGRELPKLTGTLNEDASWSESVETCANIPVRKPRRIVLSKIHATEVLFAR